MMQLADALRQPLICGNKVCTGGAFFFPPHHFIKISNSSMAVFKLKQNSHCFAAFDIEVGSGGIALQKPSVWVPRAGTGGLVLIAMDPLLKGQQGSVLPVLQLPTEVTQTLS